VPFLQVGVSGRGLYQDIGGEETEASGTGFAFGGGINAHFNPPLAFTAGVTWSVGNVGTLKVNDTSVPVDSESMTTARVQIGITWFPQAQ
jgi:hypothetical protein